MKFATIFASLLTLATAKVILDRDVTEWPTTEVLFNAQSYDFIFIGPVSGSATQYTVTFANSQAPGSGQARYHFSGQGLPTHEDVLVGGQNRKYTVEKNAAGFHLEIEQLWQ